MYIRTRRFSLRKLIQRYFLEWKNDERTNTIEYSLESNS